MKNLGWKLHYVQFIFTCIISAVEREPECVLRCFRLENSDQLCVCTDWKVWRYNLSVCVHITALHQASFMGSLPFCIFFSKCGE